MGMTIQPGPVTVNTQSKLFKGKEFTLTRDNQDLCRMREGWKGLSRIMFLTLNGQEYQTVDQTSWTSRTVQLVDNAGQIFAVNDNQETLTFDGQSYGLEGINAIDWVVDQSGARVLQFEWASGSPEINSITVQQPVTVELLAVATTIALFHGSNAGGG